MADLHWVYLIMPGLIVFTLSSPFALTFNVVIDYTWYIVAYGAGIALTVGAFGIALIADTPFSLDGVMILRSAIYCVMAVLLVAGWWRLSRRYPEFRLTVALLPAGRACTRQPRGTGRANDTTCRTFRNAAS